MYHPDDTEWPEVEKAFMEGTVYDADIDILKRFSRVVSRIPPSHNAAFHAKFSQYCSTIRHLIEQHEAKIGTTKAVLWSRIAALAAVLAAIFALLQWLFPRQIAKPEPSQIAPPSQHSSADTPDTKTSEP